MDAGSACRAFGQTVCRAVTLSARCCGSKTKHPPRGSAGTRWRVHNHAVARKLSAALRLLVIAGTVVVSQAISFRPTLAARGIAR
jgi:hypothetical protein